MIKDSDMSLKFPAMGQPAPETRAVDYFSSSSACR